MPISFEEAGVISGVDGGPNVLQNPTSLQFGPDGRLYVTEQNGTINALTISISDGKYVATAHEEIVLPGGGGVVQSLQNHNDDGSLSGQSNRQVTGIVVAGTAENPVLYVSSSDPRIASNGEVGLDTNSGVVTQVTWNGTEWETVDLIRGLPRSEENHATNGMELSDDGTKLYLNVGGNTNNGAPSSFFSYTAEYALSGTVLEIDLVALEAMPTQIDPIGGQGGTPRAFKYDMVTLDDPNVANDGVREDANGMDTAGPWGGNDGLNMAILPADAPLRIFADGFRNHYDLAFTPDGKLYTVDNGSNGNLGDAPNTENGDTDGDGVAGEAINTPNNGGSGDPEPLFLIEEGGYYGHANPVRSNQNMSWTVYNDSGNPDGSVTVNTVSDISDLVPNGVQIADGFLIDPSTFAGLEGLDPNDPTDLAQIQARLFESGVRIERSSNGSNKLAAVGSSTNGIVAYDSGGTAFDGVLDGKLFVTQFNDNITLLNLNSTGDGVTAVLEEGPDGIFGTADDVIQSGGADGILEVANNSLGFPLNNPLDVTVGPDGTLWTAEIGGNEITVLKPSGLVLPGDNDSDDDGILNINDPFLRDATNGTSVVVSPDAATVWEFSQDAGDLTPGPDGFGGGLTGAMINGTLDFEEFFQSPSPRAGQVIQLDNVKFVTAAAGGTTTIEEVTNGDPYQGGNNGEFFFHTGFQLAENVETFTIQWVVANPGAISGGSDITDSFQQIGGYIGDGTQSNFLKIVAIATSNGSASPANIQIALEDGDSVVQTINLPANDVFNNAILVTDSSIVFELEIDPVAATAIPKATFTTTTGDVVITGSPTDVIDLTGTQVLETILGNNTVQGQQTGLAAGLFATNNGSNNDTFQAVFDSITVTATEAQVAPDAVDDSASTGVDVVLNIPFADLLLNDSDANPADTISITSVGNATNGTVSLDTNAEIVTFTPDAGYEGPASFDYTITDSSTEALQDTATVSISVADRVVLYRVNAGGAEVAAIDSGPNWTADEGTDGSEFRVAGGENTAGISGISFGGTIPTESTPLAIFQGSERWDPDSGAEMQWEFPVAAGFYEVRLFMANNFAGTSQVGQRVFDVQIEEDTPANLNDIDLVDLFGNKTAGMITNTVEVTDGTLDIDFLHGVENPLINGIEIIQVGSLPPQAPVVNIISGDQIVDEDDGQVFVSITTNVTVPFDETVDVLFTIEPVGGTTAGPNGDFEYVSSSAVFGGSGYTDTKSIAGGSSDLQIPININPDDLAEGAEAFKLTIVSVSPNASLGSSSEATVTIAANDLVVNPGDVLYRINAGGAEVAANDGGPAWSADQASVPNGSAVAGASSPFLVDRGIDGTTVATSDDVSYGNNSPTGPGGNNTGAPDALFTTERYSVQENPNNIGYAFDVENGNYTVNLYFDELFFDAVGERIFDVEIEDNLVLDDFDTFAQAGNSNDSIVRSFVTNVDDGELNVEFLKSATNNPHLSAIEIIASEPTDSVNGISVSGGDFSSDPATPNTINLAAGGSTTIVSNLEGGNLDRDFFHVIIPDGYRLSEIVLDGYQADANNAGFFGLVSGSDFVIDPAIPALGTSPDGIVDANDLDGGIIYTDSNIGANLLPIIGDGSIGAGFDASNVTGDLTGWLNQGGTGVQTTLTFVTEAIEPEGQIVAAINAGGPALTQDGIDFSADDFFVNGSTFADGNNGNGPQPTFDNTVYETERYGGSSGSTMSYEIPVTAGLYTVELYFAEIFASNPTERVFDVTVEGQLVLDDFDILAQNGGDINQPIIFEVPVAVSPDTFGNPDAIDIDFSASTDNGKVSAIVVRDATPPTPSGGEAVLTINNAENNIEASNFGNNSFQISNTGNKNISFIEIDVTDALFPDAVFDPFGLAGDGTAKILTLNGGSDGGTGLVVPAGGFGQGAIGITYFGTGGIDGYEKIRLEFTDFAPGESIAFGVDMDPNSIAGSLKSTLDSGAFLQGAGGNNLWDVGGIGGAELSGSLFTVGYDDGTSSSGQVQGQGTGQQMGGEALSSQDSQNLAVTLTVNGLGEGAEGTYSDGGPQILVQGPAGEVARILVAKGFIVPFTNNFADSDPYAAQLDAQLQALEASGFPANNAVEMLYVDVPLNGTVQDISSMFDFTQVAAFDLSVPDQTNEFGVLDEAQLPLGIVASVIDVASDQSKGPVTSPIHLTYAENSAPTIDPIADIEIGEAETAAFAVSASDLDGDSIALSVVVTRDSDGSAVDPAEYTFTDNGDGTGSFEWDTDEADDGAYTVAVTASDGASQTVETLALVVNEVADPQPGDVLYRVNAGGVEQAASDGGPVWSADTQGDNSPFLVNPGSNNDFPSNGNPNTNVDISDLAGTGVTAEVIGIERWDNTNDGNGEMAWAFEVQAGLEVTVNIYVAELFTTIPDLDGSGDASGDRIFDISVDGVVPLDLTGIDPFALTGAFLKGGVVSHTFISDGVVDLEFLHVSENPAVKAIEIVVAGDADTDGPTATLVDAPDVSGVGDSYTFTVEFADASGVDVSTLDNLDVTVSNGAAAFSTAATLVSIDVPADGTPRTATYEITPPGGSWDELDNGTYDITLNDAEVADILGNTAAGGALGSFDVDVQPTDQVTGGSLDVAITPGAGLDASTFGSGSFTITNTSQPGVQVTSLSFDLSSGILPDIVFDPTGAGGDATASPFTPNSGAATTGLVVPGDPASDPFSVPRNGGFDVLTIDFTDFDPGEVFTFTTDIDPNSIQGVPGAGAAGAVSGYELIGGTVTATFTDGTSIETSIASLFHDGSLGGSQATVTTEDAVAAPTLTLVGGTGDQVPGLPGTQSDIPAADFVVEVTGPANGTVEILQMDSRLFIASGAPAFDVSAQELPFYANEAMAGQTITTVQLDASGTAQVPLSLLETAASSGPDGGVNYLMAVVTGSEVGLTSEPLVVKLGAPLVYNEPGIMTFNGSSSSVLELPHDPAFEVAQGTVAFSFNAGDLSGQQGLFSKDASFFGGGGHTTIYLNGSTLIARLQDNSTSAELSFGGIVAGQEYEIATTFGPNGVELWVDGNLVDSDTLPITWENNDEFLQWGGRGWSSSSGSSGFDAAFNGTISDKQIYSEVLTASQIASLAASSSGQNTPPTAVDDDIQVDEDSDVTFDPAANDSDDDGDTVTATAIASQPANGTAVLNPDGTVTYTPDPDFNGNDSFEVTVSDGLGGSTNSTVSVTVNPVNDDPTAVDDGDTTTVDVPLVIDVVGNDIDVDGDVLSAINVTDGANGTTTVNPDGTVTYTPDSGFVGDDSFTYDVTDGNGGATSSATVSVTVLAAPNVPPVAAPDAIQVDEDDSVTFQPGANDSDDDGDTVIADLIAVQAANGTAVVNPDGTVTYTPDPDFNGNDSFDVQVTDGNGGFDTETVTVTVNSINDQPTANDDSATTSQNTAVVINLLGNDVDADGPNALSISNLGTPGNGSLVDNGNGTVTYTPDGGFAGDDTFTYTITDGDLTDTASVSVSVSSFPVPVVDMPGVMNFNGSSGSVLELPHDPVYEISQGTIAFSFNPGDLSGQQGLFSKDASGFVGGGNHFVLYLNGSTLNARFQDGSSSATLTFGGLSAGVDYDIAATFGPDGSKLYVDGVLVASNPLVMDWTTNVEVIQWGGRGWASQSGQTGFDAPFNGTISDKQVYDVALSDAQVAELAGVGGGNSEPVAIDDDVATDEDTPITFDPTQNDTDVDGDAITLDSITGQPANGTAEIGGDGLLTYTPDADFVGIDMFDIVVADGNGGTDTSTVTVTVAAVDDDPVANDDAAETQADVPVDIDVLANDVDVDGDTLSLGTIGTPANGTATANPDGTITYTPDAGFIGTDTFDYEVSDGAGPTDTGTVTVEVSADEPFPDPVFAQPGVSSYSGSSGQVDNFAPDPLLQTDETTVAFSFIDGNPGSRQGLVTKDASFNGNGGHFAAYIESGDLKVRFQDSSNTQTFVFDDIVAGQEYEVAAVIGDNFVELWVDGSLVGSNNNFDASWSTNTEYLQIGGLGWGSSAGASNFSNPFSGQIADVEIYGEALDSDQIQILADESSFDDL
ncbi:tandem-95 repeat protein [Rhodobacteraceae bacterium NNCM2]|nr:tandem-95 repeat protein [Coraliihabitans acroporae]